MIYPQISFGKYGLIPNTGTRIQKFWSQRVLRNSAKPSICSAAPNAFDDLVLPIYHLFAVPRSLRRQRTLHPQGGIGVARPIVGLVSFSSIREGANFTSLPAPRQCSEKTRLAVIQQTRYVYQRFTNSAASIRLSASPI